MTRILLLDVPVFGFYVFGPVFFNISVIVCGKKQEGTGKDLLFGRVVLSDI